MRDDRPENQLEGQPGGSFTDGSSGEMFTRRKILFAALYAAVFSFCMTAGSQLEKAGTLFSNRAGAYSRGTGLSGPQTALLECMLFLFAFIGSLLWWGLRERIPFLGGQAAAADAGSAGPAGSSGQAAGAKFPGRLPLVFVFVLYFLFYVVVLYGIYPGFFCYDAATELSMFRKGTLTTWHPIVPALLLGSLITKGTALFGNVNRAIFVYFLGQAALMSGGFTLMTARLRRARIPGWLRTLCFLYAAAFPTVVMFVLCSCSDAVFALGMLVFTLQTVLLAAEPQRFFTEKRQQALFAASLVVMILFRKNALYALVVFLPFLAVMTVRGRRRRILAVTLLSIVFAVFLNRGAEALSHAEKAGQQEAFSIPIQQIARTYCLYPDDFSEADRALLFSTQPEGRWLMYDPVLADEVKEEIDMRAVKSRSGEYLSLYGRMALRHPDSFLDAFLMTNYKQWYPYTLINCYGGMMPDSETDYFMFAAEEPGYQDFRIDAVRILYRAVSKKLWPHRIPLVRELLSPGAVFLFFLNMLCGLCAAGRFRTAGAFVPALLMWMTFLLGPCTLVRYVAFLFFLFPLTACLFIFPSAFHKEEIITCGRSMN